MTNDFLRQGISLSDKQAVKTFTNNPSNFLGGTKFLLRKQALEKRKEQDLKQEAFELEKKENLEKLLNNDNFKWFIYNIILPYTVKPKVDPCKLQEQLYNLIKAEVYEELLDQIVNNKKEL